MKDPETPPPRRAPVLFDVEDPALGAGAPFAPHEAPQPPEAGPQGAAAIRAARLAAAGGSPLGRWFWTAAGAFLSFALGVAAWDFVTAMIDRNPLLGAIAAGLAAALALALAAFALREVAALARLDRIDGLRDALMVARARGDRRAAEAAVQPLARLYVGRPEMEWALADLRARSGDQPDAPALLDLAETTLMAPLDAAAEALVARSARSVAIATALVPVALVDVLAALSINLRMTREIGRLYGGRGGWLGSLRLMRAVAGHLLATGAVAVGDDVLGPIIGGGVAAKLSRRFGEGLLNGALTARVGAAAIEVCRPAPFAARRPPSARALAAQALKGLVMR